MERKEQRAENMVFGLDLGTRSVVGTVGYMDKGRFYCVAQRVREHETRSMLDGQIHDIGKVAATIKAVKNDLEEATNIRLTDVCIAAAGRVLKTVQTHFTMEFPDGHTITPEDVYHLESGAVEQAYAEFLKQQEGEFLKYYLVGYSTMHYYLNDYMIANLESHDAGRVSIDLIATFLPDDVVDGLYKACERADLTVANLTLEPIAAIEVAIPEKFRMLNLALIDVGAGTSDICITNDGAIVAYGMLPVAGDHLTEVIAKHCLVDFNTGDEIKVRASKEDTVSYTDIMGLEKKLSSKEIMKVAAPAVREMAEQVTGEIRRLNGGEPVSAIFIVGGGGKIPGYVEAVAKCMGLPEERVALRGEEVMKDIIFMSNDGIERDSRMVTPLGICMSYYEANNNFVFVNFNGEQVKLYDNGKLAIADVAMQVEFPNEDLFPKRGKDLVFTINGKERIVRGKPGESAEILLNGQPADIHARLHGNDIIEVRRSTTGPAAQMDIEALPEFKSNFKVNVNGQEVEASRVANVNGQLQTGYYGIHDGDDVRILDYDTAEQIAALLDIEITPDTQIIVNNEVADRDTPVYENFKVEFRKKDPLEHIYRDEFGDEEEETADAQEADYTPQQPDREPPRYARSAAEEAMAWAERVSPAAEEPAPDLPPASEVFGEEAVPEEFAEPVAEAAEESFASDAEQTAPVTGGQDLHEITSKLPDPEEISDEMKAMQEEAEAQRGLFGGDYAALEQASRDAQALEEDFVTGATAAPPVDLHVIVNGGEVTMTGKSDYIFVDIFDYIDFDLKDSHGRAIVTQVNGASPDYMQTLSEGDRIEIYWKED
ncbi:MAG: rod shape-determining protein [Lachnospiraceae bacterium]|nr:rod shape-determining protein [Lachnospiraceae bacterium]